MKLIELLLEILGWLQIVIGITLGLGLLAFVLYLKWSNDTGKFVAITVASTGFIFGCIWATMIWRKHGTIEWLSRINRIS